MGSAERASALPMLSYGLKVAWFALSLSGLLGSWASFHVFARAVRACWVPVVYCSANTVLQGIFCLGLIWRLNPFMMPHAFCVAQTTLMQASWACITGVCATVSLSTASRVLTRNRTRMLQWFCTPASRILLVLAFPTAVLVSQLVTLIKIDTTQPTDDMNCDGSHPIWVRVLGYSGASLLLAIPSFVLSFLTALRISQVKGYRPHRRGASVHGVQPQRISFDTFTPMPMRRQSKRSSMVVSSPSFYSVQDTLPQPNPSVARVDLQSQSQSQTAQSQSTSSVDLTASEASGPHVVASRSHSPSASIALSPLSPPGRAKTTTRRTKYHLPSDWITPPRVSPEELQQQLQQQLQQGQGRQDDVWYSQTREDAPPRFTPSSMSNPSRRSTYSPIIFASSTNNPNAVHEITIAHSRSQSRNTTPSVTFGGNLSRGPSRLGGLFGGNSNSERERRSSSSPSSWFLQKDEEKMGMRFQVQGFTWDGRFVLDSEDGVSGSLRWAKTSSDEERDYEGTDESSDKSDGVDGEIEGVPSYLRRQSTELGPWRQIPPIPTHSGPLWRIVIFQLFLSLTQIIASISSLHDLSLHKSIPSPFGTQHVALLLVAWGPCFVFGFDLPWRKFW